MSYPIDAEKGRCFKCGRVHPGTYSCERTTHTPGPWIYRATLGPQSAPWLEGPHIIENSDGELIATMSGWRSDTSGANARLIAQSLRMFELLKRYASECAQCDGDGRILVTFNDREAEYDPCEACADIRAVIEKAEGRE